MNKVLLQLRKRKHFAKGNACKNITKIKLELNGKDIKASYTSLIAIKTTESLYKRQQHPKKKNKYFSGICTECDCQS